MAKLIQYGTITATDQFLKEGGYKTLQSRQKVVIEKVLFTLKLVLVKTDPYTNSFYVLERQYVELEDEQLTIQFD